MKTFVLIILIFGNNGNAVTTQEFSSQEKCIAAQEWVTKQGELNFVRPRIISECLGK